MGFKQIIERDGVAILPNLFSHAIFLYDCNRTGGDFAADEFNRRADTQSAMTVGEVLGPGCGLVRVLYFVAAEHAR